MSKATAQACCCTSAWMVLSHNASASFIPTIACCARTSKPYRLMCYTHHLYASPIYSSLYIPQAVGCGIQNATVRVYCTPAKYRSPHALDVGYDIHWLVYTAPLPRIDLPHIGCGVQYSPVSVYCTPATKHELPGLCVGLCVTPTTYISPIYILISVYTSH